MTSDKTTGCYVEMAIWGDRTCYINEASSGSYCYTTTRETYYSNGVSYDSKDFKHPNYSRYLNEKYWNKEALSNLLPLMKDGGKIVIMGFHPLEKQIDMAGLGKLTDGKVYKNTTVV